MNAKVPGLNITVGKLMTHLVILTIVIVWTVPTFGLFISSLRDKDQLSVSGWWTALRTTERSAFGRTGTAVDQVERSGEFVITGTFFKEGETKTIQTFSDNQNDLGAYRAGETIQFDDGTRFTLNLDGSYEWVSSEPFELERGKRFFYIAKIPPRFSLENYREVLVSEGIAQSFLNTATVAIPATIIPIAIAAFAAYAFAWMRFPGRQFLFAVVVGLLVVPLQMTLIPLLKMYNTIGLTFGFAAKNYPGIWLAHTGFGLPLAIYLLRNYIGGLPRDIIESAEIDGASHFEIFIRLILPLSIPALASFTIFQFLWVWNDLLVALVFLGQQDDKIVLTAKLAEMVGTRGANWEILTSSAFISIVVPLIVFFSLQRYFVRGMLTGSVKGG
jgi:alpha-glucoside transport system permease protein